MVKEHNLLTYPVIIHTQTILMPCVVVVLFHGYHNGEDNIQERRGPMVFIVTAACLPCGAD